MTRADTTYRDLETGRDAAARRAWPSAYDALSSADAAGDLGPEDLEILAKAAWWTGRPAESIDARERPARIEGQVRGVAGMTKEDRHWIDVVTRSTSRSIATSAGSLAVTILR